VLGGLDGRGGVVELCSLHRTHDRHLLPSQTGEEVAPAFSVSGKGMRYLSLGLTVAAGAVDEATEDVVGTGGS